jgi:hypothetical protein
MRKKALVLLGWLLSVPVVLALLVEPAYLSGVCSEVPIVNLPYGLRQQNWTLNGNGSCVHASLIMLLRWQGHDKLADSWKANNGGGEYPKGMSEKMDKAGIRFAVIYNGDIGFLDWACSTRRGCGIVTGICEPGDHCVCLVHLDSEWAGILDNNHIGQISWMPRADFILWWKTCGGWAFTPCYSPSPPLPK